jgi:hypothetical protein
MISIQPKQSVVINPKTGAPYTAASYSIQYSVSHGAMLNARPTFYDSTGAPLPAGAIGFLPVAGQSNAQLQTAESTDIARACAAATLSQVDAAAAPVLVLSRGIALK